MRHPAIMPGLSFEDAMSVHVLRAQGMIFSELTRRFGANPARFHEILCANLHPGSWEAAIERLRNNDPWHGEIAALVEARGRDAILTELSVADPAKRRFRRQLKRLLKSAPPVASAARHRPPPSGGPSRRIGQR